MNRKREILDVTVGFLGALLGLYGLVQFNRHLFMALPLSLRMITAVVAYWAIAVVPVIVLLVRRDSFWICGFSRSGVFLQILTGLLLGIALSAVFTLIPHLLGLGSFVDNGKQYTALWQFLYEFLYCVFAVGLIEEFLFRGFLYGKLKQCWNHTVATVVSSALFGLFHLFTGNWGQMLMTALLGALFCVCKNRIRHCSTLSLAIAHGIYDALISVLAFAFS